MTERTNKPATVRPWNFDLSAMPTDGRFEVLRLYDEVFRHMPDQHDVIEPRHGRMFVPFAWRPCADGVTEDKT